MFDSSSFKQQFPLFSHPENAQLVYLDNAATTQRPSCVIDAITEFYCRTNANTHRSSHRLSRQATEMVERVRDLAKDFVGASRAEEMIFVRGATEALNLLAYSLTLDLKPGDEIVLSPFEHHANLVPWQMAAQRRGLTLRFLSTDANPDEWCSELGARVRVLSVTAASNATGQKINLRALKNALPEQALMVVDASQVLAHERVNVGELGCDFLVGSAHKFYGPTGVGLLFGRFELLQRLAPWQGGGEMIERVDWQESLYAGPPHRFEPGTSSLAAIAGLGACLEWLMSQDREAMGRYEQLLNRYLHGELQRLESGQGLRLLTRFEENVGVAALAVADTSALSAADVGHWLDEQDIAVRVGHHCAQPYVNSLGLGSTIRISLAAYNNRDDVDRLVRALQKLPQGSESTEDAHLSGDVFAEDLSAANINQLREQESWQKRYRQLTRWAVLMKRKPEIRVPGNRVRGCETEVWMIHQQRGACHYFAIDTDSRVIQGLGVLLLLLINGRTGGEIMALELEGLFAELGLSKYLSASRSNGFRALLDRAVELVRDGQSSGS